MALMDHTERHPCRRYRNMESPCIEFLNARVSTPVVLRKVSTIIVLKGVSTPVVLLILSTPVVLRWFSTNIVLLPLTVAVGSSYLILKENYYYILPTHKDFLISGWCGPLAPPVPHINFSLLQGCLAPWGPPGFHINISLFPTCPAPKWCARCPGTIPFTQPENIHDDC